MSDKNLEAKMSRREFLVGASAVVAGVAASGNALAAVAGSTAIQNTAVTLPKTLKRTISFAPDAQFTSPVTGQTMSFRQFLTDSSLVKEDIEILVEKIVTDIAVSKYDIMTVAAGIDMYFDATVNMSSQIMGAAIISETGTGAASFGPFDGDGSGTGGNCNSEGGDCGGGCNNPSGDSGGGCGGYCKDDNGNTCGDHCSGLNSCSKPNGLTGMMADNLFLVNFHEYMNGNDIFNYELVARYKTEILMQVMHLL